jgi:GNAT superfamily N-acetyltransferase
MFQKGGRQPGFADAGLPREQHYLPIAVARHLVKLTGDCRCSRFGNFMTDATLRAHAAGTNYENTLVLACYDDGQLRGIAELRSLLTVWCEEAEAAFSVELAWRRRGVGTALMGQLIRSAYALGVPHVYLNCHPHNRPMQRISHRFGAQMSFQDGDCTIHLSVQSHEIRERLASPPACRAAVIQEVRQ